MTLIVQYEETKMTVDQRVLKTASFFHFRELIAIPRMNDLIFRRRLFNTAWLSRKRALTNIRAFLSQGKELDISMIEGDLSLQRDYNLLFAPKDKVSKILSEEAKYLPQNQSHQHHEKYALIAQLSRYRLPSADLESPHDDAVLLEAVAHVERNTPKVGPNWIPCWLADEEDESRIGPEFLAPSATAADKLCKDVNDALEAEEISGRNVGLCALDFLPPDPQLLQPRIIEQERKLVFDILSFLRDAATKEAREGILDLNERIWDTGSLPPVEA